MGYVSFILFIIGLVQYFEKRRYITLIVIITLASGYFRLVNQNFSFGLLSLQHGDVALVLIFCLLPFRNRNYGSELRDIKKAFFFFVVFLTVSILFDIGIRETSIFQVFRTIRKIGYHSFLFLIYSFSVKDYKKAIKFFVSITVIHAILYVSQYIFGTMIVSYGVSENELGKARYNNWPTFLTASSVFVIFNSKKNIKTIIVLILIMATILTQSRGMIASVGSIVLFYNYFRNRLKLPMLILSFIIFIIIFQAVTILMPIIGDRFMHMMQELKLIKNLNYNSLVDFYHQGSLIFRWGITYERIMYVIENPVRIFLGVGFVPDMDITQPIFTLGTNSPVLPTGREQFNTIDIFFPNIITRFGILGSGLFLWYLFKFFSFSYNNLDDSVGKTLFVYLVSMLLISFINETFYNGFNFLFIFLFVGLVIRNNQMNQYNNLKS
jgi:hypothetical protein